MAVAVQVRMNRDEPARLATFRALPSDRGRASSKGAPRLTEINRRGMCPIVNER